MSKLEERFEKIKQTLKENDDKAVKDKIVEDIKVSYKIFTYDFEELQKFAENFMSQKEINRVWRMDCYDSLSELSKETLKLLNNYILASKSLRDHTKVFVNSHYKNSKFSTEHEIKIKEIFGESQLLHFVQELRNYTFNKDLPLVEMAINESEEVRNALALDINKLSQWSGWTSCTKEFIDKLEEKIELSWFVKEYWIQVDNFYQWFNNRIGEIVYKRCS